MITSDGGPTPSAPEEIFSGHFYLIFSSPRSLPRVRLPLILHHRPSLFSGTLESPLVPSPVPPIAPLARREPRHESRFILYKVLRHLFFRPLLPLGRLGQIHDLIGHFSVSIHVFPPFVQWGMEPED